MVDGGTVALHEYEKRFQNILENSNDIILTVNNRGEITYVTPSIQRLGYSPDEVITKSFLFFIPEPDRHELLRMYNSSVQNGVYEKLVQVDVLKKDGSSLTIEVNISPFNVDEDDSGFICAFRDVSLRTLYQKRVEALHIHASRLSDSNNLDEVAERTFETIEQILGYSILAFGVIVDDTLRFTYIKGATNDERIILQLSGPGITVRAANTGKTQLVNDVSQDPDYFSGAGGRIESFSELAVPILHGKRVVAVINLEHPEPNAFNEDDQKLVELLAMRVGSELSRLDHVRELKEKNLELIKLDAMKNRFISMVTHEIRSPLTSIMGYADIIISGHVGEVNHKTGRMLKVIKRNADRITALYTDLADTQILGSGHPRLNITPVHVGDLVMMVVDEIHPVLDARKQKLVMQVPGNLSLVLADEPRIIQVLVNLLDNASKFSSEGQEIFIAVLEEEGYIEVTVADAGIGISEEDMPKLFEPFPDIEKPHIIRGTGLGLSICKGILDLHGGEIWAESEGKGKGSAFTFSIPVSK
jgi:PAS domain S-box-containing protein